MWASDILSILVADSSDCVCSRKEGLRTLTYFDILSYPIHGQATIYAKTHLNKKYGIILSHF